MAGRKFDSDVKQNNVAASMHTSSQNFGSTRTLRMSIGRIFDSPVLYARRLLLTMSSFSSLVKRRPMSFRCSGVEGRNVTTTNAQPMGITPSIRNSQRHGCQELTPPRSFCTAYAITPLNAPARAAVLKYMAPRLASSL
jgi:hypothetical protein